MSEILKLPFNYLFITKICSRTLVGYYFNLEYPDKLDIQDDSTDGLTENIHIVNELAVLVLNIKHIPRIKRIGFKAGALKEGLRTAEGIYCDFLMLILCHKKEWLLQTIPHFERSLKKLEWYKLDGTPK
jgi:hypothetical protein